MRSSCGICAESLWLYSWGRDVTQSELGSLERFHSQRRCACRRQMNRPLDMSFLSRFIDGQIPDKLRNSGVDVHRRARLIVAFTLALVVWAPIFAGLYFALHLPSLAIGILVAVTLGLMNLRLMRAWGSIRVSGNSMAVILYCLISFLCVHSGGINSPATSW